MTGQFETLIYTDCRPGQGLRGDPGLQFQAKSAGITTAEMDLVQRSLLYEPPTGWINDRKPVGEYPPSLAHTWDPASGVLATAQGAYLGQEVNGSREGNQITHAIVTADSAAYGFVRPAQLMHAPFWTTEPAASASCPPLAAGWQPGLSEPALLRDFVAAQEDGQALLATLLTALGRLGERHASRVMFIADRPEQAVQWIAAATLLLPLRQALTIGFKAFTVSPGYCPVPVLAVHPDWAAPYRSFDPASGFVVLDLVTRRRTEITLDELATRWVRLFLESDPYDVIDAVELAGALAAAGATASQAHAVAVAATFGRARPGGDVATAAQWIATAPAGLVADYGGQVLATIIGLATGADLVRLDRAAAEGRMSGEAPAIRTELLRQELLAAVRTAAAPEGRLQVLAGGSDPDRKPRTDLLAESLRAAPDESVDAVLRVAWRHRLSVPVADVGDRMRHFAAWWADRPDLPCEPGRWPSAAEISALLRAELAGRLERSEASQAASAVRAGLWRPLLDLADDPALRLDAIVLASAMREGNGAERTALIRRVLGRAVAGPDIREAASHASEVLWSAREPTAAEALAALAIVPPDVPVYPGLTAVLQAELENGWRYRGMRGGLDAAEALRARGVPMPSGWRKANDDDRRLADLCRALSSAAGRERELTRGLDRLSREVLVARAGWLAETLSGLADTELAAGLLAGLPSEVGSAVIASFAREFSRQPAPTARRMLLLRAGPVPQRLGRRLEDELRRQLTRDGSSLADAVGSLLARDSKAVRASWAALVDEALPGR